MSFLNLPPVDPGTLFALSQQQGAPGLPQAPQPQMPTGAEMYPQQQDAHPGLTQLAYALQTALGNMPPVNPRQSQGDQFGQAFLRGLAGGFSGGRIRADVARNAQNDEARKNAAQINLMNLQASNAANAERQKSQAALDLQKLKGQQDAASGGSDEPVVTADMVKAGEYPAWTLGKPVKMVNTLPSIQARIAGQKKDATTKATPAPEPQDYSLDVTQTALGSRYVDLSRYTGKQKTEVSDWARRNGVHALSAAQADALQNIETTRKNLADLYTVLSPHLPETWEQRMTLGPRNILSSRLGTDPDLASYGTARTAAIQAMRSAAGSKGLRINRAEIEMSAQNDIPQLTDTKATAAARVKRMNAMLDRMEQGIVGGNVAPSHDPFADVRAR